ncbi:MAG TPA: hypothetical protein VJV78_11645 [Polyangiales bacterium]|nr:hypothetical protein [Polyangiales bacterium]
MVSRILAGLICTAAVGCSAGGSRVEDNNKRPPVAEAGAASGTRATAAGASTEAGAAAPRNAGSARSEAGSQGASGNSAGAGGSAGTSLARKGAVAKTAVAIRSLPATGTFTPTECGFATFQLEVKDNPGATMTKRYVVFVACS